MKYQKPTIEVVAPAIDSILSHCDKPSVSSDSHSCSTSTAQATATAYEADE